MGDTTGVRKKAGEEAPVLDYGDWYSFVENAPDNIMTLDRKGTILFINRTVADLKKEDVIGTSVYSYVSQESKATMRTCFERVWRTGEPGRYYVDYHASNGDIYCFESRVWPVMQKGKVVSLTVRSTDITERKKAEEALKWSEEKHRTLFETMAQGVVYQDAEGKIISANPAAERILGMTIDQMMGRRSVDPGWKAIHEDGSEFPGETHPSMVALKTGKLVMNAVMGVFHPKANENRWININAIPLFRPDEKQPFKVYTTFDDITERKKTDEEITNLARFPSENPNPVLRIAADYTLLYVNPGTCIVFEECGCPVETSVKDKEWRRLVTAALTSNTILSEDFHYGSRSYSFMFTPVKDAGYVNVYGLDITERKKAEDTLRLHSEMLSNMAEGVVLIRTSDGVILHTNPKFDEFFGYDRGELNGKDVALLNAPTKDKSPEKKRDEIIAFLKKNGSWKGELLNIKKDGTPFYCRSSISTLETTEHGTVWVAAHEDITERKNAEDEVRRRLELESTIASISSRFVGLFDMDESVDATLANIGALLRASRAYLFQYRDGGAVMDNTHEWCAEGVSAQKDNLQGILSEDLPWWTTQLMAGKTIRITNISELPEEARATRDILEAQDIRSLLVFPVYATDELTGFIGFDNVQTTSEWSDDDIALLRTVSEIIGNSLARIEAEEEVQAQEQFSTNLLDTMHDGVVMMDLKGCLGYVNPAFCALTGFDEAELVGTGPPFPYWPEEDVQKDLARFRSTVLAGKRPTREFEYAFQHKDGTPIHVEVTPTPLVDVDGSTSGWMDIIKDITDRKRAEEEIHRRLMHYDLKGGHLYLTVEHAPTIALDAFKDLLKVNPNAIVFSRTPEPDFRKTVEGNFKFNWFAERRKAKAIQPDVGSVVLCLEELPPRSAVLIDRLDYLLLKNGFDDILSLVQNLREEAYLEGLTVIISLDPAVVDERQRRLLEKETMPIERRDGVGMTEDLMEILRFLYRQNRAMVKPSYAEVGREFGISKPTTRKRIQRLVASGHVIELVKGRRKVLDLSERGRHLFDR